MFNQKYLGEFIEERDGEKVVVKKWEQVTSVEEHNAKIEAQKKTLTDSIVDESSPLGKLGK